MFMKKILMPAALFILLACNNEQKTDADTKMASATTDSSTTKSQPSEFADAKYTDMAKRITGRARGANATPLAGRNHPPAPTSRPVSR